MLGASPAARTDWPMDTRRFRTPLVGLREQLLARLQRLDRHLHHRAEPLPADSGERAIELENRELLEGLDDGAVAELQQVEHALARIDTGDYGRCEGCRAAIPVARLELVPFAVRCAACARATEH